MVRADAERRVDVVIGGQPFTLYVWPTRLKKPVSTRFAPRRARSSPAASPWTRDPVSASIVRITSACGSTTAT